MSWAITESDTTVKLDDTGHGSVTFTVTNTGAVRDRSVVTVSALDGASEQWWRVEEPQRVVAPGASVDYLTELSVPPTTPPATYGLQAVVYSADADPSESSVTSNPVRFTIPKEEGKRRGPPMWLVVLVIVWVTLVIIGIVIAFLAAG
jgi:hypothetical protein